MKHNILIVYYSLTGNTRFLAESIHDAIDGSKIAEIKPVDIMVNPDSASRYFFGGAMTMMKKIPDIEPMDIKVEAFDLLFLCCPVWAWRLNPVMRSFLITHDIDGKRVAIVLSSKMNGPKPFDRFRKALPASISVLGQFGFVDPAQTDPERAKKEVQAWALEIVESAGELD